MNRMIAIAALALMPAVASAQNGGDRQAVQQAAANYVTAVYESKLELIEQSVHPKLTKYGAPSRPPLPQTAR
jgi:type II secretory pathway pseudopilin PulG